MKTKIEAFEHANEILNALSKGVLLTTKTEEKVNTMVISWGTIGIEWNKPIITVFVRENRYTKKQLDKNPEFTINIPKGEYNKKILGFCGTKSGHDVDKIKELGLTLVPSDEISVPGIKELPLTLECKVVYQQAQVPDSMTEEMKAKFYPQDVPSTYHASNKDYHTAYYAEIVNAYIISE